MPGLEVLMSRRGTAGLAVFALAGLALVAAGEEAKVPKPPSLYQRLGGYDTLAAVFDDVGPKLAKDPLFAKFFSGHATDSDIRQRQRAIELLCQDSGGPCFYTGRPLRQAHGGLAIGEAQWSAFLGHLTATLDHLKVGAKEKAEVLTMVGRYKSDVVEKP
jgi:hemoglobin